jgi:hypothetical protein
MLDPISFESRGKLTGAANFQSFVYLIEIVVYSSAGSAKQRGNLLVSESLFESQSDFTFLEWSQSFHFVRSPFRAADVPRGVL